MILFKKIRYKNFLSTGNTFTEIDLDKHKTTLIVGHNGAGKSILCDALSYALFNKPYRNINKPQLVNSITKRHLVVEIEFETNQIPYKVVRGINPAIFQIYENGTLINQSADSKDYQELLEKNILKANFKTFCQVSILGTATYVPFMSLPAQARREVIENILDLRIFSYMNVLLKSTAATNESNIKDNLAEKRLIKEKRELIRDHAKQLSQNNQKLIADKKERIKDTNKEIADIQISIEDKSGILEDLNKEIADKKTQQELKTKVEKYKYKIENKVSKVKSEIKFFSDHSNCPTCEQEIHEGFKAEAIEKRQAELNELENGLVKIDEKLDKVNSTLAYIRTIENDIANTTLTIGDRKNKVKNLNNYINELENDIKTVQDQNAEIDLSKIDEMDRQLEENITKYNNLIEQQKIHEFAAVMLKDSGIKASIIKQYVPIINKLINKYLSMMDFFVNFSMNEKFEEKILSRFRDDFSYNSFSEGEKFRINLAILFTWRAIAKLRNSINTNILFMDEVMDSSLDSNGNEEFLKIIHQLTEGINVFIISHKVDQFYDKFENVIRFEKKNNFTHMEKMTR